MSAPAPGQGAHQQAQAQQAQAQQAQSRQAPAPQQQGQQQSPAQQAQQKAQKPRRTSSTPGRLRFARALATAAAALTGIVATGTFDTGGVNPTPNVIASQWVSAERAGVAVARGDLAAARAVAEASTGSDADRESFHTAYQDAVENLTASGSDQPRSAGARELLHADVLAERAVEQARTDPQGAAQTYAASSAASRAAGQASGQVASESAENLNTGSRSGLTALLGGLATVVMIGVMVWLALLTRRMINVPLLIATAITGWLTYVSLNPSALPVSYEDRVDAVATRATAMEEVLQARQAQYAVALGLEDELPARLDAEMNEATRAIRALGETGYSTTWQEASEGIDTLMDASGTTARLQVIDATGPAFDEVTSALHDDLVEQFDDAEFGVGTTASVTSGVALLLGLIAAALAWSGLTQRLRDYR